MPPRLPGPPFLRQLQGDPLGLGRAARSRRSERLHENLAWSYPAPLPESQKVAGLIAFYNEKVDILVDGEREERPVTPFS